MATTVFGDNNNEGVPTPKEETTQNVNVFADQLSTITNEKGEQKYDTVEKAIEALKHSQDFIPTLQSEKVALEAEVTRLREQVAQAKGVQDVVDKLTNRQNVTPQVDQPVAALSAEDIAKLITQQLSQGKVAETQQANELEVDTALKLKFGTEASKQVALKAHELDITPKELGVLAAKNPKMVLQLFGTTAKQVSNTTTSYNFAPNPKDTERLQPPEKSLMQGAKTKDVIDYMKQIQAEVYKDNGVET
jgi:hypothetical protein